MKSEKLSVSDCLRIEIHKHLHFPPTRLEWYSVLYIFSQTDLEAPLRGMVFPSEFDHRPDKLKHIFDKALWITENQDASMVIQ